MTHRIAITVADVLLELSSQASASELGIVENLGAFMVAVRQPVDRVRLIWEEAEEMPLPDGDLLYDPGLKWKLYRQGQGYCASFQYPPEYNGGETAALLCPNSTWDELTLTERRLDGDWRSLVGMGAGELIFRSRILYSGGLILHASAVIDNGRGIVFVGHSGAGKSTHAGLWRDEPGVVVISDDRTAVRVGPTGAYCYGTPWGGSANIAENCRAPLAALVLLEQGPENSIARLAPSEAGPLIAARSFLPYWDRNLMRLALLNLNATVSGIAVYRLVCRPEKSVIPLVRTVL